MKGGSLDFFMRITGSISFIERDLLNDGLYTFYVLFLFPRLSKKWVYHRIIAQFIGVPNISKKEEKVQQKIFEIFLGAS